MSNLAFGLMIGGIVILLIFFFFVIYYCAKNRRKSLVHNSGDDLEYNKARNTTQDKTNEETLA